MRIDLPEKVEYIIETLQNAGYEAYAVGGCVRDSMLGREPKDWDVTTSADPYEVKALFRRTVDTGIKHGTVTVMFGETGYEVTTYRLDGEYEDARHPKEVTFTKSLQEDLKRRDFTINAMAYNQKDGLVDLFGGKEDLEAGIIRCVGTPGERFDEDALRILRALRFSAQLGFAVESETEDAIRTRCFNLNKISAERIRDELNKLLLSALPERLLALEACGIAEVVLPEVTEFLRQGERAAAALRELKRYTEYGADSHTELILCWATLLNAALLQEGYVDNQARKTAVKRVLQRLKFDNDTILKAASLAGYSTEKPVADAYSIRKQMHRMGETVFDLWLIFLEGAPVSAEERASDEWLEPVKNIVDEIRSGPYCVSLKQLAINGADLIAAGRTPGVGLGETLEYLLEQVLEHPEWNNKEMLLKLAGQPDCPGREDAENGQKAE